ncbi:MAG: hypothetical protein K2L10_00030 [Ruminococcus sp.]|nr:hypothetical protein [Ruminococcus sp.]
MRKKSLIKAVSGACIVAGMLSCSVTAYATTVEDVARVAREYGYSEDLIQQGFNQYYAEPERYTSEDFDYAIEQIIEASLDVFTTSPQIPKPVTSTTTTVAVTNNTGSTNATVPAENVNTSDNNGNDNGIGNIDNNYVDNNNVNTDNIADIAYNDNFNGIILQMPDGSEFTRVSTTDFIRFSYEQKMDYIRSFTPEQQQVIYDNLTPEERRSLLKQLPVEQKAEYVDSMASFGETFGLNINVEEISADNISLSMRNNDGELVGIANAGVLIEDTGYDRRGICALSAGMIAVAGILLAVVSRYFRTGDEK